jgi:enamine deaminase RidA (YjgF/YER057c/UK114 family)
MSAALPRPVDPPDLAPTGPAWSHVTVGGGLVFVSGQVAWDAGGSVVGAGSVEEQAEFVFDNLERALRAAGSSLDRLTRICVYLVDDAHVAGFREVRDRRLTGIRPASTLVIVAALVDTALLVEIDAIAVAA